MNRVKRDIYEAGNMCIFDKPEKVFERIDEKAYTNDYKKAKDILSITDKSFPYGSFNYKDNRYPNDIDILDQVVIKDKNIDNIVKKFAKEFQGIVKKINKNNKNDYYLGDIKLGMDQVYTTITDKYLGILNNGIIEGSDFNGMKKAFNILKKNGYLSNDEYKEFMKLYKMDNSPDKYDLLEEFLRNKETLRWSGEEVLQGYKMLGDTKKVKLTIEEALKTHSVTKIDMYGIVNGKFLEITALYVLVQDKDGKYIYINVRQDFWELRREDLKPDIEKFMYNKNFFNPLKSMKRLYAYVRFKKNYEIGEKIAPLLQSEMNLLSNVKANIETVINMLKFIDKPPLDKMLNQLDGLKPNIARVLGFNVNNIIAKIDNVVNKKMSKDKMLDELYDIKKMIFEIIDPATMEYLKCVGLYPIPNEFLPEPKKYNI